MNCSSNSFPRQRSLARIAFLIAVVALPALDSYAQTRSGNDPYQKISFKTTKPCIIAATGEVTSLVKNNVELSVTEDWDCDGVPDAYDNCVGMPNPDQTDRDNNGIGDVCEAGVTIKAGPPTKSRSNAKVTVPAKGRSNKKSPPKPSRSKTKAKSSKEKQTADRSHSIAKTRRRR